METPSAVWELLPLEVIPYNFQGGQKDAIRNIIRRKVLYCI